MINLCEALVDWFYNCPFLIIIISFLIGLITMPYVLKVSIRKQLVVKPNKRTSHKGNIPNVGGINIFTAFLLSYLIFSNCLGNADNGKFFLAGLYLMFFVGFLDDLLSFSPRKKFIGEVVAGFIVIVIADIRLTNLHGFFGINEIPQDFSIVSYLVSFFLFLLITNSLNLIDGVDGLATGIGIVICAFFGIYFELIEQLDLALMAYSLIGALALFFIYNVFGKKSKIFMGDSGALVLGYIVYVFVVKFCEFNIPPSKGQYFMYAAPAMSFCVLAIPLFDTLRVMVTRIKKGYSPFKADKNHVHHLLLGIGLKHRQVTMVLVSVNLTFVALALIGHNWENWILGGLAVLMAVIYTFIMWRVVDRHRMKQQQEKL